MTKKIQAKNTLGQLVELEEEEVARIATSLGWVPGSKEHNTSADELNKHYHEKAISAIRSGAAHIGVKDVEDTEEDMKELLAVLFSCGAAAELKSEIMYEIVERAVSCHWKKIHRSAE